MRWAGAVALYARCPHLRIEIWGTRRNCCVRRSGLVGRRLLGVVDDERFDGAFGGVESQTELFLQGGKKGGRAICGAIIGGIVEKTVGRPFEVEVVVAGEAGLVDDGAIEFLGEDVCER